MTNTTKHTQGGWSRNIAPARKYSTIYAGRNTHVAHLAKSGMTDEELEANANLIAAAPDLLEALQSIVKDVQRGRIDWTTKKHPDFSDNVLENALTAIAKAKGE
jgi:hypothetical protein